MALHVSSACARKYVEALNKLIVKNILCTKLVNYRDKHTHTV